MAPNIAAGNQATPAAAITAAVQPVRIQQVANFSISVTAQLADAHEGGARRFGDTADTCNAARMTLSATCKPISPTTTAITLAGGGVAGSVVLGFTPAPIVPCPAPARERA